MGLQSSRIIWGKNKLSNANEPGPVELYNENYIYVAGNYAIKSDGKGKVAEDYHLYLCTAEETGGTFNNEDWKIQKGVKNWYLISGSKIFKKGARTIKEDVKGDFSTLKLYKCIVDRSSPASQKGWVPEEWEVVYQDTGIAWMPRDHKDVYYDDGKNKEKWHRLMWFVPEYMGDEKEDLEICPFEEGRQYHYGDRVLHWSVGDQRYFCYTYKEDIPRSGEWDWRYWELQSEVDPYETYKMYLVGDEVIRKHIHSGYQQIMDYCEDMYYDVGSYCIHKIDRERDINEIANFHSVEYIEKFFRDETLYGIFVTDEPSVREFGDSWKLIASGNIYARIESDRYWDPVERKWKHGGEVHTIWDMFNPDLRDIKTYEHGKNYLVNDLVIWTTSDDDQTLRVYRCVQDLYYDATRPYSDFIPYNNDYYWDTGFSQLMQITQLDCVYECIHAMNSYENTHFIEENWKVITQKVDPNYGLYGVIWEKLAVGNGSGIPFYFPIVIGSTIKYGPSGVSYRDYRIDNFFPFTNERSHLDLGPLVITKDDHNVIEYGINKIIKGSRYFYAYYSTSGIQNFPQIISNGDILVSQNSQDWSYIKLDLPRAIRYEIIPCENGFIYIGVRNATQSSINDVAVIFVTIGLNLEKINEEILEDNLPYYIFYNRNLLINNCFNWRDSIPGNNVRHSIIFSNGNKIEVVKFKDIKLSSEFTSSPDGNILHMIFRNYIVDIAEQTETLIVDLVDVLEIGIVQTHEIYNETHELPGSEIIYDQDYLFECPDKYPYAIYGRYAYFGEFVEKRHIPLGKQEYIYYVKLRLYKLDLDTYTFVKFHESVEYETYEPHNYDFLGAVMDIPYYNHETCYLGYLKTNVHSLNLYNTIINDHYQYSHSHTCTIVDGVIQLNFDSSKYYNTAHGSSNNGRPSNTSELFISDLYTLFYDGRERDYYICVYVPNYGLDVEANSSFSNAGAFFWLFSSDDSGGPFYGGPDGNWF